MANCGVDNLATCEQGSGGNWGKGVNLFDKFSKTSLEVEVYVSSNEDVGFTELTVDYFDWLVNFIEVEDEDGENGRNDDLNDVIIVHKVLANPKKVRRSLNAFQKDDDDDCVVLRGDLDKPLTEDSDSGSGSNDLIIVSEKGL
ncbi:hypothetical protein Ancab_032297 [Ancistrocladus abbreviatus]